MRKNLSLLLLFIAVGICAADFTILDGNGTKLQAGQKDVTVEVKSVDNGNGIETVSYKLTSLSEKEKFYQVCCSITFDGNDLSVFDGKSILPATTADYKSRMLYMGVFPMAAAWDSHHGLALAAGAKDHHTYLFFEMKRGPQSVTLQETVNAALLKKGSVYEGRFHIISFDPKYKEAEAFARYYRIYPECFQRSSSVDPRIYDPCAGYSSWIRTDPERTRFLGAGWEWCIFPTRHWGDMLDENYDMKLECYTERWRYADRNDRWNDLNLKDISRQDFRKIQKFRLDSGYFCNVMNAFYTCGISRIHNDLAVKFPDSLAGDFPEKIDKGYDSASSVFAFPETSWGKSQIRMIKEVAARDEIGAIAFDIPLESEIYRGPALLEMSNVSYDRHGAGIARAVANSRFFEEVRKVPQRSGAYKLGVAANINQMHQINDCFFVDTMMLESNPWQYAPPWPRSARYAMGEKACSFWEGFHFEEFNPDFKRWPPDVLEELERELSLYVAHRSFLYGITYPAHFLNEYLSALAPAMKACNNAGWKPVPGMTCPMEKITLTRYGRAEESLIAICNTGRDDADPVIEIFPEEFRSDVVDGEDKRPLLFAGFYGSSIINSFRDGREYLSCNVKGLRLDILEAVASAAPGISGKINIHWDGGFKDARLIIESEGYDGPIALCKEFGSYKLDGKEERSLEPGRKIEVSYNNKVAGISDSLVKSMTLLDSKKQPLFKIYYSADHWSREMAERTTVFFRNYGRMSNPDFKLDVKLIEDPGMPPCTIALSLDGKVPVLTAPRIGGNENNLVAAAGDRDSLRELTNCMLNLLNRLKYPEYICGTPMTQQDRDFFKTVRW